MFAANTDDEFSDVLMEDKVFDQLINIGYRRNAAKEKLVNRKNILR